MRIPHLKENIFLGDFFMMIVLFTALNAFLESFFFRRADPVWLFFVFGLLGLRLVARFPIRSARRGIAAPALPQPARNVYVEAFWRIDMSVMVVLAGCGNMGFAMLSGWLKSGKLGAGGGLRRRAERRAARARRETRRADGGNAGGTAGRASPRCW